MVHNVVHLQLRTRRQLHPRGDVQGRPRLFEMPLRHLVLQGLPWPVCTPHKFHNFRSSKERPGSCEHHQDQPTKGSTICEPAKDDSGTPENNNQEGNDHSTNNNNDHLIPNNEEGDTQANNSEDEG